MLGITLFTSKPSRTLRLFLKLPIHLYRLHLGWLLGHRFLLLTHRGRKTGFARQTVLEVIKYDASTSESIVVSGWGQNADWFLNIKASPALAIQIGRQWFRPVQYILSPDEAYSVLEEWQGRHPIEGWIFRKLYGLPEVKDYGLRHFVVSHPVICFRPGS